MLISKSEIVPQYTNNIMWMLLVAIEKFGKHTDNIFQKQKDG